MSSKGHNKRRSTGIVYELLINKISRSLVEGDQKSVNRALRILKSHFKPGTELFREFRLITALARTTVASEAIAASILREARDVASSYDVATLDREKSLLIRNINHKMNDDIFFDQHVNEYRIFATIQTLMNEWRSPNRDIVLIAKYEDQLIRHLVTEKVKPVETNVGEAPTGSSRLIMKVMMNKLNERYDESLTSSQKDLIRSYALSTATTDESILLKKLTTIKENLLTQIDAHIAENQEDRYVNERLVETRTLVINEAITEVNDETVTRFMLYLKLNDELSSDE